MTTNQDYKIEKELAKAVQKSLLAHQVDAEKSRKPCVFSGE